MSSNTNDSNTILGETQNLSRRLQNMTGSNNTKNDKRAFRRSISESFKPDTYLNIQNYLEDNETLENHDNANDPLNWNDRDNVGIQMGFNSSALYQS